MEMMTSKDLARYLSVKEGTIRAWTSQGIVPFAKLGPGEKGIVRYERGAIDKWIKGNLRRERRITKRQCGCEEKLRTYPSN